MERFDALLAGHFEGTLTAAEQEELATLVRFDPGARTAWHTHPLGQTLYVTMGAGRAQVWGGPIREIRAGDVIWFSAGE